MAERPIVLDDAGLPTLTVRWTDDRSSKWRPSDRLVVVVELENNGEETLWAKPALTVRSPDGRSTTLGRKAQRPVRVRPGKRRKVRIGIPEDLALAHASQAVSLDVAHRIGRVWRHAHAPARHLEYSPDFQRARLVDEVAPVEPTGAFPLAETLRTLRAEGGGVTGGVRPDGSKVPLWRPAVLPKDYILDLPIQAPQFQEGYRLCFGWEVVYTDSGFGEDYLNNEELAPQPARHALAAVQYGNLQEPMAVRLNSVGCTPTLDLEEGDEVLFAVQSQLERDGAAVEVLPTVNADADTVDVMAFNVPAKQGLVDLIHFEGGAGLRTSQAAAVIAQMMAGTDAGLTPESWEVIADQTCAHPDYTGSACYYPGLNRLYLGPNNPEIHTTDFKYVVAHEFGHALGDGLSLDLTTSVYEPYYDEELQGDAQAACGCAHVVTSNQSHCIQSREDLGDAIAEGFAHFVATRAFNDPTQNDCTFVYYKEFLDPETNDLVPPPNAHDCAEPVGWRDTYCPGERRGTEVDWLAFFWDVHRHGEAPLSIAEISAVLDASANVSLPVEEPISWGEAWASVDASAAANLTPDQYSQFVGAADAHGVTDP